MLCELVRDNRWKLTLSLENQKVLSRDSHDLSRKEFSVQRNYSANTINASQLNCFIISHYYVLSFLKVKAHLYCITLVPRRDNTKFLICKLAIELSLTKN